MKPRQAFLRAILKAHDLEIQARYLAVQMAFLVTEPTLAGEATVKELSVAVGTTERSIHRWLGELSDGGWFRRTGKRSWCLVPPAAVVHTDTGDSLIMTPVSGHARQGPNDTDTGVMTPVSGLGSEPDTGVRVHIRARASDPDPSLKANSKTNTPSDRGGGAGEGDESESDFGNSISPAEELLRANCLRWIRDPVVTGLNLGSPDSWPEIREATEYFTQVTACRVNATPKHPAIRLLVERMAEGYTISDVKAAIDGANRDPWMAKNPQFLNLQTILRDGGQIERFRDLAHSTRPPPATNPRGRPIQPTYPTDGDDIDSKHKVLRS